MKIPHHTAALANLNHWRAGQGAKIRANRPLEVYRACEHLAQLAAPVRDPLILTAAEIDLAMHRAISLERRRIHGIPGKNPDEWWEQIKAIADRWKISTARADWEKTTKTGQLAEQSSQQAAA